MCCAPSNVAVDNLLEKLARQKIKVVRIGHPARVQVDLQKYSLDAVMAQSDQKLLSQDVKGDMEEVLKKLKKVRKGHVGERQRLNGEMRQLRKELRTRESLAIKETLKGAEVVLATLTSASHTDGVLKHLAASEQPHFDLAVIDECSQSLEIACWIALLQVRKVVLAGDHLQLPPTIMSEAAAKEGLAYTLMERVIHKSQESGASLSQQQLVKMLNIQYRYVVFNLASLMCRFSQKY